MLLFLRYGGEKEEKSILYPALLLSIILISPLRQHTHKTQQEAERGYWLYQARKLYDDRSMLASLPRGMTRARTAQRRHELTPLYLRGRAELGEEFPDPNVRKSRKKRGRVWEEREEVAKFALTELKPELFVELMGHFKNIT